MKDNYTYAAIFDYSEEGYINIEFPEFENLFTSVDIDSDPIQAAQEILALELKDYSTQTNLYLMKRFVQLLITVMKK